MNYTLKWLFMGLNSAFVCAKKIENVKLRRSSMNIKKFQISTLLLVLVTIVISLVACDSSKSQTQSNIDDNNKEFQVGVILPLTGSLKVVGNAVRNASELALEEINNESSTKIRFIVEDSNSTPEGAVEAFNKLVNQDGVTAIIGPVTSSASKATFPLAQEKQVVALSPLAAASGLSQIGDYVFQANLTTDAVIPGGVELTKAKLGYQKVAVLVDNNDLFSQSAYETLVKTFGNQEIEILATEFIENNDTNFSVQLNRIKDVNPDAIFISTLPLEAVGILTQAKEAGISEDIPFIIPFAFSTDEIELAGDAAEGVITFSTWTSFSDAPGNKAFVENYNAKHDAIPSRFLAQGYATVYIFAEALNNAKSTDSNAIRDALADITDLDTILGKFSMDDSGQAVYDPIIIIVNNGEFEVFK